MHGTYDVSLVVLSVIIAIFASYGVLDLTGRVTASHRRARAFWLIGGASTMGLGIWSMHYIGMLAFKMAMPVLYNVPIVIASLLAAVVASAVALFTVSRPQMGWLATSIGSLAMGAGIASMHYIGMAAMRMPAYTIYHRATVLLSIFLAVIISFVALRLAFRIRDEQKTSPRKILSALIMGSAIPVMHYTGMHAASFIPTSTAFSTTHAISITSLGVFVIGASTILILTLAILTAFLDRLVSAQKSLTSSAQEAEKYFRTLAEALPTIIWTALPDGHVDYYNKRWYEYTGKELVSNIGDGWPGILHPEDVPTVGDGWRKSVATSSSFELECRILRASDGQYRWHLLRALPLRNALDEIIQWFGTCTDIHEQKTNQKYLEEEVRRRTDELVEANARIKQEMEERAQTQDRLNRQSAELVHALSVQSQKNTLLAKMSDLLQACNTVDEAFSIVLGFAPKIFPEFGGAIILLNSSRNLLEVVGDWAPCQLATRIFDPGSCWALRTGHRYTIESEDSGARCVHVTDFSGPYICIPIQAHGEALGIIHFQATKVDAGEFTEAQLSLCSTFGEQFGLSLANIRLREALKNQSIRDAVTGLFNRRYLEETLQRELHRCMRSEQPLAVIMLDLDHFKRFNDSFGHEAGDSVLRRAGELLSKSARVADIACRYGGEEFVLILPGAGSDIALQRAEEIRAAANQLSLAFQGKPLGDVTFSAGIAVFPEHGTIPAQLLARADGALYDAKKNGRDRVVLADMNVATEYKQMLVDGVLQK